MDASGEPRIAMIGFGEAGRALVAGWGETVAGRIAAYDLKAAGGDSAMADAARQHGLDCFGTAAEALAGAQLVFCLVTADQALAAAETGAPLLGANALWFDGNSCSPGTKRRAAAVIEAVGGRYVDLAIMAPVHPRRHLTPGLVSGPHAEAALAEATRLGMKMKIAGEAVGDASTIKMLRSVMIKGFEALSAECLLAARRAGVEEDVLASLQASDPGWNWRDRAAYNLERMSAHGIRRAAEMREVALTLRELDLPDRMAAATALWQDELGGLGAAGAAEELNPRLDAILARLT